MTIENFVGQGKQLGHDVCTTAVVAPSWEHEEGGNQLGLVNSGRKGFTFLVRELIVIHKAVQVGWIFEACNFFFFPQLLNYLLREGRGGFLHCLWVIVGRKTLKIFFL